MFKKLCIIISSKYPPDTEARPWNQEVQRDLRTIKTTLNDHKFIEITIPIEANKLSMRNTLQKAIDSISEGYRTCHIVLNTHGASGRNDLKDEAVQMLVKAVSDRDITITQISALLCHGGSSLSAAEARNANPMAPIHAIFHAKKATMIILQEKLNAMTTKREQCFEIRGFNAAYLPEEDQEKVIALLQGEGGIAFDVVTKLSCAFSPSQRATDVLDSIRIVERDITASNAGFFHKSSDEKSVYNQAANILGMVLKEMKENIVDFLKEQDLLKEESRPLYNALIKYCKDDQLKSSNVENKYKQWVKNNKIYTSSRIQVYTEYAEELFKKDTTPIEILPNLNSSPATTRADDSDDSEEDDRVDNTFSPSRKIL